MHLALLHPDNTFVEEATLRSSWPLLREYSADGETGIIVAVATRTAPAIQGHEGVDSEYSVQFSDGCVAVPRADVLAQRRAGYRSRRARAQAHDRAL